MINIHCKYSKLIPIETFVPHDRNTNEHPQPQIDLLAKIIKFQGVRHPIIISNLSGKCVAGHGRYAAFKQLEMTHIPVDFQDFDNAHQEYAFLESDNLIAELAEHDEKKMMLNIKELNLSAEFDMQLFGKLELPKIGDSPKQEDDKPEIPYSLELGLKDDYIVLLFKKKDRFKEACEALGVKSVQYDLSPTKHEAFRHTGVGRVINGEKLLDRL